jgi:hypothetical protein
MKHYIITLLTVFLAIGSAGVLAKDRDSHGEGKGYSGIHDLGPSHHSRKHYGKHGYDRKHRKYQSHKRHNRHFDGHHKYSNFRGLWRGVVPYSIKKNRFAPHRHHFDRKHGRSGYKSNKHRSSFYRKHVGKHNNHSRKQPSERNKKQGYRTSYSGADKLARVSFVDTSRQGIHF